MKQIRPCNLRASHSGDLHASESQPELSSPARHLIKLKRTPQSLSSHAFRQSPAHGDAGLACPLSWLASMRAPDGA